MTGDYRDCPEMRAHVPRSRNGQKLPGWTRMGWLLDGGPRLAGGLDHSIRVE